MNRPIVTSARSDVLGRIGRTKSIVTIVEAEFRIESTVEVIAATSAARISPRTPTGRRSKASVGKARSGVGRSG